MEKFDHRRLTRDIDLAANSKVGASIQAQRSAPAANVVNAATHDIDLAANSNVGASIQKTPARCPAPTADLVTPSPQTAAVPPLPMNLDTAAPSAPVHPVVAPALEATANIPDTPPAASQAGTNSIRTAEDCLNFVQNVRKEAAQTENYPDGMIAKLKHIAHECVSCITQGSKTVLKWCSSNGGRHSTWHRQSSVTGNSKRTIQRTTKGIKDTIQFTTSKLDVSLKDEVVAKIYSATHSRPVFSV